MYGGVHELTCPSVYKTVRKYLFNITFFNLEIKLYAESNNIITKCLFLIQKWFLINFFMHATVLVLQTGILNSLVFTQNVVFSSNICSSYFVTSNYHNLSPVAVCLIQFLSFCFPPSPSCSLCLSVSSAAYWQFDIVFRC